MDQRFPEPRVLAQDDVFFLPDGSRCDLTTIGSAEAAALLEQLRVCADDFHAVAVHDERFTTSTGMRTAMRAVGIELVEDLAPDVWLESTALVRSLRRKAPGQPA